MNRTPGLLAGSVGCVVLLGCGTTPATTWNPLLTRSVPQQSRGPADEARPPQPGLVFRHHIAWGTPEPAGPDGPPVATKANEVGEADADEPATRLIVRKQVTIWGAIPAIVGSAPGQRPVEITLGEGERARSFLVQNALTRWEALELRVLFELDGREVHGLLPDDPFTCDLFAAEPKDRTLWPISIRLLRAEGGSITVAAWIEESHLEDSQKSREYLETSSVTSR